MRKAVVLRRGSKYNLCCDVDFLEEFTSYVLLDPQHIKEINIIFSTICEGLKSKKYGDEPHGTKALKPFFNRENDRIICNVKKAKGKKQCIVMSEIFLGKKTNGIDKELNTRYKIVSGYEYDIIEST